MFWSIVSENDVFLPCEELTNGIAVTAARARSSNPYDYLRGGYYLDNAVMFGGKNIVNFNCRFSGYRSGTDLHFSDFGKRPFRNIS